MPFILSAPITLDLPGQFGEGAPYQRTTLIDINSNDRTLPPVNYDLHHLKPHSIPHVDAQSHIVSRGSDVESYFSSDRVRSLFGPITVLRIRGERWDSVSEGQQVWRVAKEELIEAQRDLGLGELPPDRLFIAPATIPLNSFSWHAPDAAFVLQRQAAEWLTDNPIFCTFGTSWRTSDFEPGSRERPIHKLLLRQAAIFECLDLGEVPSGRYFLSAFPLRLAGASESPVCPVLFTEAELKF
jgi:kynurenine formamidase